MFSVGLDGILTPWNTMKYHEDLGIFKDCMGLCGMIWEFYWIIWDYDGLWWIMCFYFGDYPLVICYIAVENGPVDMMWVFPWNMEIFHSYIKLPEGIWDFNHEHLGIRWDYMCFVWGLDGILTLSSMNIWGYVVGIWVNLTDRWCLIDD